MSSLRVPGAWLLSIAVAVVAVLPCRAAGPALSTAAILDFDAAGIPEGDALIMADMVRVAAVELGAWTIVERGHMADILREQALQQTGCTATACAVKLGRILQVQLVVTGTYRVAGGKRTLSGRLVNVATGRDERQATESGFGLEEVDAAAARLVAKLAGMEALRSSGRAPKRAFEGVLTVRTFLGGTVWVDALWHVKPGLSRVEMEPGNPQGMYSIMNQKLGSYWVINPMTGFCLKGLLGSNRRSYTTKIRPKPMGIFEEIAGVPCELWSWGEGSQQCHVWLTRALGLFWRGNHMAGGFEIVLPEEGLYPMKCTGGRFGAPAPGSSEVTRVESRRISGDLFNAPSGYRCETSR